eukprot:GEZU01007669.1.p1 GENE.GEZU01007669.1~~GEZU01007669.1.p1  ORF type:complete len:262 (+),score=29.71 GEZU01007669.1:190-975(+)
MYHSVNDIWHDVYDLSLKKRRRWELLEHAVPNFRFQRLYYVDDPGVSYYFSPYMVLYKQPAFIYDPEVNWARLHAYDLFSSAHDFVHSHPNNPTIRTLFQKRQQQIQQHKMQYPNNRNRKSHAEDVDAEDIEEFRYQQKQQEWIVYFSADDHTLSELRTQCLSDATGSELRRFIMPGLYSYGYQYLSRPRRAKETNFMIISQNNHRRRGRYCTCKNFDNDSRSSRFYRNISQYERKKHDDKSLGKRKGNRNKHGCSRYENS